jgi:hypothetical protein
LSSLPTGFPFQLLDLGDSFFGEQVVGIGFQFELSLFSYHLIDVLFLVKYLL